MSNFKPYAGLTGWSALSFSAGVIGTFFEPGSWYDALATPFWTPPDLVFPVLWPVLYTCMGVTAWQVGRVYHFEKNRRELKWFFLQLVLNTAWSWLFFVRHEKLPPETNRIFQDKKRRACNERP